MTSRTKILLVWVATSVVIALANYGMWACIVTPTERAAAEIDSWLGDAFKVIQLGLEAK